MTGTKETTQHSVIKTGTILYSILIPNNLRAIRVLKHAPVAALTVAYNATDAVITMLSIYNLLTKLIDVGDALIPAGSVLLIQLMALNNV